MDGISILLDGVCGMVEPYEQTTEAMLEYLTNNFPDAVGFTHRHPDHFLGSFVCDYENKTDRQALVAADTTLLVEKVKIHSIVSRHLGRAEEGLKHSSFLIEGSKRVLFTGDAAPTAIKGIEADVLIAPYAYANSPAGLKAAAATGAKHMILVHMPACKNDAYGIWDSVQTTLSGQTEINVLIPELGQSIYID